MGSPCLRFSGVVPRQSGFWRGISEHKFNSKKIALFKGVGVALTICYLSVSRLK